MTLNSKPITTIQLQQINLKIHQRMISLLSGNHNDSSRIQLQLDSNKTQHGKKNKCSHSSKGTLLHCPLLVINANCLAQWTQREYSVHSICSKHHENPLIKGHNRRLLVERVTQLKYHMAWIVHIIIITLIRIIIIIIRWFCFYEVVGRNYAGDVARWDTLNRVRERWLHLVSISHSFDFVAWLSLWEQRFCFP